MTDEITLTMSKDDWRIFRKALREYDPTEKEKPSYNDLLCWANTDWED